MPHVQIDGPCDIQGFWSTFQPTTRRETDRILKAIQAYLENEGRGVLVECMVVEGYLRQSFLAQIVHKEGGLLVKIFHATHPERTPGVRSCLAWLADQLLEQNTKACWASDNLGLPARPGGSG